MNKLLDKIALPVGIVLIISLLIGAYLIINRTTPETTEHLTDEIVIDVAGAVDQPGVYYLTYGAIIEDALEKAGGVANNANFDLVARTINRAAILSNHDKIYVPALHNTEGSPAPEAVITSNLININGANSSLLETLPGIGPITAGRIIDYREQSGIFTRINDLTKVEGISTSKYNKIKDLITV